MSCLGNSGASIPGESVIVGKKRARDADRSAPESSNADTTAYTEAPSESRTGQSRYATGFTPLQEYDAYSFAGVGVDSTTAYTTSVLERTPWTNPAIALAAHATNFRPDLEPFENDTTLAALFGYPLPADEPPIATEPLVDPWAFALGPADLSSQPSLSDTQADIMNLFGGNSQEAHRSDSRTLLAALRILMSHRQWRHLYQLGLAKFVGWDIRFLVPRFQRRCRPISLRSA